MKKFLLPQTNSYKANLHSHSTISDGCWTPEQMKKEYQKRGYSIVAYTDHNMMIDHHKDLSDSEFLALRGFEVQIAQPKSETDALTPKTCHICSIALDPDNLVQPCVNQKHLDHWRYYNKPAADWVIYDKSIPEFEYAYTVEKISEYMERCREEGFFVTYNHPVWSLETDAEYTAYHGMHAMEMCNYGCFVDGYEEYNPYIYDRMLRSGKRIFCIGADDNHNRGEIPERDSFGAFTVILAEKLDYKTVTDAMLRGDMYASQGPLINSLFVEDGCVHITCSPARRIYIGAETRFSQSVIAQDGKVLTEAVFTIPENCGYFRLTVEDAQGRHANTRAYFPDEL